MLRPRRPDRIFSEKYACPEHGGSFEEPAPRNFSFNSPHGACPDCTGLGSRLEIDPDLVLPNDELSVDEGAILPWRRMAATESWFSKILDAVAEHYRFRTDVPVRDLSDEARQILLYGNKGQRVDVRYRARNGNVHTFKTTFEGIVPNLTRRYRETGSEAMRAELRALHDEQAVPDLQRDAPQAGVGGRHDRRQEHHRDDAPLGDRCAGVVRPPPEAPERAREPDRGPGAQGDPGAARIPRRRRARLPDARPRVGDALGGRGAAHPARDPDRLEPDGRALHPRRAVDRPPPARQRPAHRDPRAASRPRQHAARRRARRGDDPVGGLGHRHRPGGGGARRPAHPLRAAARAAREPSVHHGGVPARRQGGAGAGAASQRQGRGDRRPRARARTTSSRSTSRSRWADSWRSPASAARASRAW